MDKKSEILEAAFILFAEKGYYLSMSELAAAVGIKTPSLYSHFSSKDQIIELVMQNEIEAYFHHYENAIQQLEEKSCKEQFEGLYTAVFSYLKQDGRLRFWRNIPLMPQDELRNKFNGLIQEREKSYNEQIILWLEKGITRGEVKEKVNRDGALLLYFAVIQGMLDMYLLYRSKPDLIMGFAQRAFEAFWDSLKTDRS